MLMSCRLDALMGDAVAALESLELRRAALHDALREAHFAYSVAQREMDRSGLLLGWPAVPTAAAVAVEPRIALEWRDGAWAAVAVAVEGQTQRESDPARWFAASPPAELRDCAAKFAAVLEAVTAAAAAQEKALEAAQAYRMVVDVE